VSPRSSFTGARAAAVAAGLDLDVFALPLCFACLGFVAMEVDAGVDEARKEARRMAPDVWAEGLEGPALEALRRACDAGSRDAEAALADVALNGGRSITAREIVLRLATDLHRGTQRELRLEALARPRLAAAPPELN